MSNNSVEIELRPHIGRNYNSAMGCIVDIEHSQWIVLASVNGSPMKQVGYVGKQANAPLNGTSDLRGLPAPIREQVREEVQRKLGADETKMFVPIEPDPLLLGADADDDDDE